MQQRLNASKADEEAVISAVADSFAAIIDDILVAYGASQIVISGDTTSIPVVGFTDAVRIGESVYIYAVCAFNAIVILTMVFEAIRTRTWRGLLKLDYASIKSAIVSSSAGGDEIARLFSKVHRDTNAHEWLGDSGDAVFR
jgi:hypothetical protein